MHGTLVKDCSAKQIECKKAERDVPQVQQAMNQLSQTIEMLEEATSRLDERIRPILAIFDPSGQAVNRSPETSRVPLAALLDELQGRLTSIAERLASMFNRVEL
jgi:hypothetical protein